MLRNGKLRVRGALKRLHNCGLLTRQLTKAPKRVAFNPIWKKDYAANPIKLANNKIFADLTAASTAIGRVLYLESGQCNTTAALEAAGIPRDILHAVTSDSRDYAQITSKYAGLRADNSELSEVLKAQRVCLRSAWLDYCGEPYGTKTRSPPRDIARTVSLLARGASRNNTAILAITAASSRLGRGRLPLLCKALADANLEDLAPSKGKMLIPVIPFLTEVVSRAAVTAGVRATEAETVQYKSAGSCGQLMTFMVFRIAKY